MPRRNSNQRNHAARSPLMRKGGAHVQSKTGERVRERLDLEFEVEEWLDEISDEIDNDNEEKDGEHGFSIYFRKPILLPQIVCYHVRKNAVSSPRLLCCM